MGHAAAPGDFAVHTIIDGVSITNVNVWAGEIIDGMQLIGTWNGQLFTGPMHGSTGRNPRAALAYPSHHVSSIWLDGARDWNNFLLPDVMVVGFKMD
ncbi:MAG: hypothetical protein JO001_01825 [Alphaproteobacteria bacterium]|nr:hypothetical protein [Alphaproteobacteria bacterium]